MRHTLADGYGEENNEKFASENKSYKTVGDFMIISKSGKIYFQLAVCILRILA
jgi:hypothetical protein